MQTNKLRMIFTNKAFAFRMLVMFVLGFSSGLPLSLVASTLMSWYTVSGVSIEKISLLALISQPYVFKFLWAPFLDVRITKKWQNILLIPLIFKVFIIPINFFSRLFAIKPVGPVGLRRGWLMFTQLCLSVGLIIMSLLSPHGHPFLLAAIGFGVACFSATQDIANDAYRIEILPESERGLGSAMQVEAYRLAMLFSGGFALIIADYLGWQALYLIMAASLVVPFIVTYFAPNSTNNNINKDLNNLGDDLLIADKNNSKLKYSAKYSAKYKIKSFFDVMLNPIKALWGNHKLKLIGFIFLIILYKFGDAFAGSLTSVFLLRELDFSLSQVGMINKVVGLSASLLGIFFGGLILMRVRLFSALFAFGVLQMLTNLMLLSMCYGQPSVWGVSVIIFCENCAGGMGTSAFVVLLMSLCQRKFASGQYALLSALTAIGRIYLQPVAGWVIANWGWGSFYFGSVWLCLPGLALLFLLRKSPHLGLAGASDKDVVSLEN